MASGVLSAEADSGRNPGGGGGGGGVTGSRDRFDARTLLARTPSRVTSLPGVAVVPPQRYLPARVGGSSEHNRGGASRLNKSSE